MSWQLDIRGQESAIGGGAVDAALAEYMLRRDRGESVDLSQLIAAYPGCEDELRKFVAQKRNVNRVMAAGPVAAAPAHDLTGRTLGDFRLQRIIGRGGMGIVWEAEQISLRRKVAVKLLPGAMCSDPRHRTRFQNEARILAQLEHPNIVNVIAVGEEEDAYYFAMQFIDGITAEELIRRWGEGQETDRFQSVASRGVLDPDRGGGPPGSLVARPSPPERYRMCARIAHDIASGLAHAHACGVLHRDVKPSNILLDKHGTARLTDFGLARMYGDATLTATGAILGTLRYASPEQLSGTHAGVDERSDVYSLGATLWELVTGKRLFAAEDHNSVITQVLKVEARRPSLSAAELPRDLETIITRAMAKEPADRYATAEALREDLQRFLEGRPILARPFSLSERAFRWANRNRSLASTAVGALVVLALTALTASALILRANSRTATALETSQANEDKARQSEASAKASERQTRELLYAADMALAGAAWKKNEPAQVRMILDRYAQPKTRADGSNEEDLRGFEWYFLDRQTRPQSELLFQNDKPLYLVEFMLDGKEFLTAGQDGIVRWHDAATGKVLRSLDTQQKEVNGVSYNPSGTLFATAGEDGTAKVWNAADLALVKSIDVYDDVCYSARFFNDESIFTCGNSAIHRVLNAATGQHIRDYSVPTPKLSKGYSGGSKAAYVRQAGDRFWTMEQWSDSYLYQGLYEWNANTGESRRLSADSHIQHVLAARSEGLLIYNTHEGVVRVFDASSGKELQSVQFDARLEAMAISPDDRRLVVGDETGQILVWKLDLSQSVAIIESDEPTKISAHEGSIFAATFSPDQSALLSVGSDGAVRRTSMQSALTPIRELDWMRDHVCAPIPGTDRVIATKPLAIRARANGEIIRELSKEQYSGVAANAGGTLIAAGSGAQVGVWNVATGERLLRVEQKRRWTGRMGFSADDTLLSVFSHNFDAARVDVLNLAAGTMKEIQLGAQRLGLLCIDDGLVTAVPRQLVCWNVREKSVRWTTKHFEMNCTGGAVSPDLRTMVAGDGPLIRLIDCASGNVLYKVPCHHAVRSVEFAPDGRTFVIGGLGGELSVWHTATGQHLFDIGNVGASVLDVYSLENGFLARTRRVVKEGTSLEEHYYEF